ncbi:MAG TPA: RIO1 family regulatory kinase/ATPase [Candidatus Nitrosopolaris sp.]|nr:RIO1 family regulatory kinase/ATPase [Candidatus Nitrosopolaris sp.]
MGSQRRQLGILSRRTNAFCNKVDLNCPDLVPVISYPRQINDREYGGRLNELENMGVNSILPVGTTKIGKFSILGKGGVGLVVKVESNDRKTYALKIRRIDANRKSMEREVKLHKIANSAGVGPYIYAHSENFILMEFIDGCNIIGWLNNKNINADQVRKVVISTLEQCYSLDMANLDHGELSCLDRHVLVSKIDNVHIIDFETSSINRKTRNVTAAAHSLLLHGKVSRRVNDRILFEREGIIQLLRMYKWNQTRSSFYKILQAFG